MTDLPNIPPLPSEEKRSSSPSAGKTTAAEQGSNIPQGWKPTMAKPLPSVRCTAIKKDGERCGAWSLNSSTVCLKHGGHLPNVRKAAEARKEAARLKLIDAAEDAADVLEYLMNYGTQEQIRLKAATEILDRTGVKGGIDLNVTHEIGQSPALILAEKLAGMAKSIEADTDKEFTSSTESDIIDVEVVPAEDPDKETD